MSGHVSLTPRAVTLNVLRCALLMSLFFVLFAAGGSFVALALPATTSEPGPLPLMAGLVVVVACSTLVVVLMVSSSRWRSLKLMAALAVSYYAAVTCVL